MVRARDNASGGGTKAGDARTRAQQMLREHRPLRGVLLGLTFATGLIDAISYLGLGHIFTANMTGNIVLLGFALAGAGQTSVTGSLLAIVAFLIGAALGGRLANQLEPTGHRWVALTMALETALLAIAALVSMLAPGGNAALGNEQLTGALYVIIALLALAMGLRNATVRRLAIPDLTTTVLTLTLTGLASDPQLPGGAPRATLLRRILAVVAMLAGAFVGAGILVRWGRAPALVVVTLLVLVIAAIYSYNALIAHGAERKQ